MIEFIAGISSGFIAIAILAASERAGPFKYIYGFLCKRTNIWRTFIWPPKARYGWTIKTRIIFWMAFRWSKLNELNHNLCLGMKHLSAYNQVVNHNDES